MAYLSKIAIELACPTSRRPMKHIHNCVWLVLKTEVVVTRVYVAMAAASIPPYPVFDGIVSRRLVIVNHWVGEMATQ